MSDAATRYLIQARDGMLQAGLALEIPARAVLQACAAFSMATPATGGQSAGETRAKEGRSTEVPHGEQQ